MAFVYQDEEERDETEQGAGVARPVSQESPLVRAASEPQPAQGTRSGAFTNLQSYLDVNADRRFGQQVAGRVQGEVDEATGAQREAESSFRQAADTGAVERDDSLLAEARRNPVSVVQNPTQREAFTRMREARYQGPKDLVDRPDLYEPVQSKTRRARETAELTSTEPGRMAYLDRLYGSGAGRYDYTPGQRNLDNLLVQNDPGSREAFQSARTNAQTAQDSFSGLRARLNEYAKAREASTAATRASTRAQLGIDEAGNALPLDQVRGNAGDLQDLVEGVDERVSAQRGELGRLRGVIGPTAGATNIGQLTPEQLGILGVTPGQFGGFDVRPHRDADYYRPYQLEAGSLLGQRPSEYVSFANEADLNRSTLSDADTQARLNALTQLAGIENAYIPQTSTPGNMLNAPLYSSRGSELASAVGQRRNVLQLELMAELARQGAGNQLLDARAVRQRGNEIRARYGLPPL